MWLADLAIGMHQHRTDEHTGSLSLVCGATFGNTCRLPYAAGPGTKKWASERWAGTSDLEGSSNVRVAELLEAVPRSVSVPMRALTAALPPK